MFLLTSCLWISDEDLARELKRRERPGETPEPTVILELSGTGSYGAALAAYDEDGDGVRELAIGLPDAVDGDVDVLRFGAEGPDVTALVFQSMSETNDGPCEAGGVLANAGDLDGDGDEELMIGMPGCTVGGADGGWAFWKGGKNNPKGEFFFSGSFDPGTDIARSRDHDDNGYDDVMIGAPGYAESTGAVFLKRYEEEPGDIVIYVGENVGDRFGGAVTGPGDTNGDGASDVVIASPEAGGGAGAAYLIVGPQPATSVATPVEASTPRTNGASGSGLGSELGSGGDVNDDGLDDWLIQVPGLDEVLVVLGSSNDDAAVDLIIHGEPGIGAALEISDLDADGSAELLVGSPFGEGAVYVFEAPLSASMELTDATTTIIGAVDGGEFGASLAVFADLDGDGIGEVAIGAPTEQTVELFTGLTY